MKLGQFASQTMRYTGVGAVCAVLNNVVIIAGSALGVHYVIGTIIAFVITTPLGYLLHTVFTFREGRSAASFLRYSVASATAMPVFFVLMAVLCSGLGVSVAIGAPVATCLAYAWNYGLAWLTIRRLRRRP